MMTHHMYFKSYNQSAKPSIPTILSGVLLWFCFLLHAAEPTDAPLPQQAEHKAALNHALSLNQKHRPEINRLSQSGGSKRLRHLREQQANLDSRNIHTLNRIVAELGHWPGIDDVGSNIAQMALVLVKHASSEQQATYFPAIKEAVLAGQLKPEWFAYLYDQWLMQQDLPQAYGSLMIQGADQTQRLYPMQALDRVNQNRSSLAMKPLQDSLADKKIWLRPNLNDENRFELVPIALFEQFAQLALDCLDKTYPNSIKHVLNGPEDAQTPEQMHPAFFGCFDWHSSVHGHWLLIKVIKMFPNHPAFQSIKTRLGAHFTADNMAQEHRYFLAEGRNGYERPYGMAWYLQLVAELHDWPDSEAEQWRQHMAPLEQTIKNKLRLWLSKLSHPIRNGTHTQTAFALGLMLDYARTVGDEAFHAFLVQQVNRFYAQDKKCPIDYEPSGHDFLSPCLAQADLMRRTGMKDYGRWLKRFLPQIKHGKRWLTVAKSNDPSDGHLSHLDGLNISRAWMLEGIASALSAKDKRRTMLLRQATNHRKSGLAAVTGEHYAGGHWLGSFALYYLTQSGLPTDNNTHEDSQIK